MLNAADGVAPGDRDPFLIVGLDLTVLGLSVAGERLLLTSERTALDSSASLYFQLAPGQDGTFRTRASEAIRGAVGGDLTTTLVVRPVAAASAAAETRAMRVGACSWPPAAILVLTSS